MSFPPTFCVIVRYDDTRDPIPGVCVRVSAIMPQKNAYSVPFHITGVSGTSEYDREEFEKWAAMDIKASPMDFSGTLDDAVAIEVKLPDSEAIERALDAMERWGTVIPEAKPTAKERSELLASRRMMKQRISHRFELPLREGTELTIDVPRSMVNEA